MRDFDVIVAGGGCAGIWASLVAAGRGARTLLVEKEPGIGEKIRCAEGVGASGVSQFVEIEDGWVASAIHGGRFCAPDGNCVDVDEPGCGYVLHKDLFLKGLADRAAAAGVEIRTGMRVVALTQLAGGGLEVELREGTGRAAGGCERLTCGSVVAADGIQSGIARMADLDTHLSPDEMFICAQNTVSSIDVRPDFVEFHFGSGIAPGGYAWVFPKGEARANVGVGINCTRARGRAGDYLKRFMGARCPGAKIEKSIAGGVPSARRVPRAFHRGLFLAGDAARAADPVSGAGIVPAIESAAVSGEFSALLALGELGPGEVEREFTKKYNRIMRWRRLRYGLKKVFTRLSDSEFSEAVSLIGAYSASGRSLQTPGSLAKFFVKSMPKNFGMLRHLVGA